MLRVTPDGLRVWVQTAAANTNVVLDAETLDVVQTTPAGRGPVTAALQPNGPYGLVMHQHDAFILVLDQRTGREVKRIDAGTPQANASFTPDGSTAFVALMGSDEVIALDMSRLVITDRIRTGPEPMGLVLLDPAAK